MEKGSATSSSQLLEPQRTIISVSDSSGTKSHRLVSIRQCLKRGRKTAFGISVRVPHCGSFQFCYRQGVRKSELRFVGSIICGKRTSRSDRRSTESAISHLSSGHRDGSRLSCSSPFLRSPAASSSSPGSPRPPTFNITANQPPPLPEKKTVSRTVSAPDSAASKAFVRAYPRLPFSGSENNVCRPNDSSCRASLPSSPVDQRSIFSSNESLERCHVPLGRPSRSRTLDEPFKGHGRLGVHCRSSITCSSSPQLSAPFSGSETGLTSNLGSSLQLQTLLSNMDSREGVYSKLGGLYAESLRRLALKCEERFMGSQRNRLRFDESNWSLFRLTSNKPSCNAGDAVYYSAACASDPSNSYAVKVMHKYTVWFLFYG